MGLGSLSFIPFQFNEHLLCIGRVLGVWLGKAVRTTETILPGSSTDLPSWEFKFLDSQSIWSNDVWIAFCLWPSGILSSFPAHIGTPGKLVEPMRMELALELSGHKYTSQWGQWAPLFSWSSLASDSGLCLAPLCAFQWPRKAQALGIFYPVNF